MSRMARKCPHDNIVYCPLYLASHGGEWGFGLGCDDGKLDQGGCAVSRGMNYAETCIALAERVPRLMAEVRFLEKAAVEAAARKAQRDRNMRALGIQ
jgi:hypothetical protein